MLLRICLVFAILAGGGTIFVTQKMARERIQGIITVRDDNIKGRAMEKGRADKAERDLASTRSTLATTSNTLAKTEEELNGAKQQAITLQDQLGKTKGELTKAITERKHYQDEIAKWEAIGPKPEEIIAIISNLKKSQDAIVALEDEKRILNRQILEMENRINILVGKEDYEVPVPSGTKGNIVAVDPKWNFVVLDIGADNNLLEGGVLLVHRNSQLVGKVRLGQVMKKRSVASMVPGWKLGDLEEGDQVLSKN